jgi:hypothetical protein
MIKKFLAGAACAAVVLSGVAFSNPSATGFFADLNLGGAYNKLKESLRHSSQKKDTQVDVLEVSKNFGFYVGAALGYGYELPCGVYIGGNIYGGYDFTKIDGDKGTGKFSKTIQTNNDAAVAIDGVYKVDIRPMGVYGAAIQVGGKIMPNVLAFASFGVEGTYTKIKQYIAAGFQGLVQNELGNGEKIYETQGNETKFVTLTSNGTEEAKIHLISLVPGLGAKYFFTPAVSVGVRCDFLIGIGRKLDDKYNKGGTAQGADGAVTLQSPAELGNSIYVKRQLGVRYGITLGYKF